MDILRTLVGGIVAVGIIAAVGMHSKGLAQTGQTAFTGTNRLLRTAEA
jgi:hypothetical protein